MLMEICKECFGDCELRTQVAAISIHDDSHVCSICGKNSTEHCDLSEFNEFFHSLLILFQKTSDGKPLTNLIQEDWGIFSSLDIGHKILSEVLQTMPDLDLQADSSVEYIDDVTVLVKNWEELKLRIKEQTRFMVDNDDLDVFNFLESSNELHIGDVLYRARILHSPDDMYDEEHMGCPAKENATAGRANPVGIPYLYLSKDSETTYYEVRATYLDYLAVGTFNVCRDLNIVDFHPKIDIFNAFNDGDGLLTGIVSRKKAIEAISKDLSRPMRRFDSEVEYVPTQLICEYCKVALNADGICFESSLHRGHDNVVLFDQSAVQCTYVAKHQISDMTMQGIIG